MLRLKYGWNRVLYGHYPVLNLWKLASQKLNNQ